MHPVIESHSFDDGSPTSRLLLRLIDLPLKSEKTATLPGVPRSHLKPCGARRSRTSVELFPYGPAVGVGATQVRSTARSEGAAVEDLAAIVAKYEKRWGDFRKLLPDYFLLTGAVFYFEKNKEEKRAKKEGETGARKRACFLSSNIS